MRLNLTYVQTTTNLARRGYLIATEYQRALGLSDEQLDHLLEYLRFVGEVCVLTENRVGSCRR